MDDCAGRADPSGISLGNEVEYEYIGLSMTAEVDLVRPDVRLDYQVKHNGARTSGEYYGYDRFGRVINHPWVDGGLTTHATDTTVPNIPPIVELDYTYDKVSNRTKMLDSRPGASQNNRDMVYTYDGLDRLDEALRGVDGGAFVHAPGSERWTLDMLGNWGTLETDSNGDGDYLDTGESEDRTHNDVNELTKIGANDDLTYDHSGNLREQETGLSTKQRFTHDLWNRLVEVEHYNGSSWSTLGEYEYYGTHWRSVKISDSDDEVGLDEKREQYYSAGWQLIEERIDDGWTSGFTKDRAMQYLWGARYIDDIIMHREDANGDGDFTDFAQDPGDQRWWHLTDVQFSTMALLTNAGKIEERVVYDAYGDAMHHYANDVDGDGDYDNSDYTTISTLGLGSTPITSANYNAYADVNRDGTINITDTNLAGTTYSTPAKSKGELSDATVQNTIGWDGYVFNPETAGEEWYHVRFRWYSTELGRWVERDPVGYVAGQSLYAYVRSRPVHLIDPYGLQDTGFTRYLDRCAAEGKDPWGRDFGDDSRFGLLFDWSSGLSDGAKDEIVKYALASCDLARCALRVLDDDDKWDEWSSGRSIFIRKAKAVGREQIAEWLRKYVDTYCSGSRPFCFEGEECNECEKPEDQQNFTQHGCRRFPWSHLAEAYVVPGSLFDDDVHLAVDEEGGKLCPATHDWDSRIPHEHLHIIADTMDSEEDIGTDQPQITQHDLDKVIHSLCDFDNKCTNAAEPPK